MPFALLNRSVLSWLQKEDDDEDKSRIATGRVPSCKTTVKLLHDPYCGSRECGFIQLWVNMNADRSE